LTKQWPSPEAAGKAAQSPGLDGNRISDLSALAELEKLYYLVLNNNQVSDLSASWSPDQSCGYCPPNPRSLK
jgi:Leucine-rich repeat (LRR) protein